MFYCCLPSCTKGVLNRAELKLAIEGVTGKEVTDAAQVEMLLEEFDTDESGTIDFCEFRILERYLKKHATFHKPKRTSSASISVSRSITKQATNTILNTKRMDGCYHWG